jgi:16S rRNA A1518/A1519 N6-dimethyltransferase RsmA/KsgA/DIM1 with predicted DNA glycosylase/AP lyase activity
MAIDKQFALIKEVFHQFEEERKQKNLPLYRKTELGYWGTSNMDELFVFFSKIRLEEKKLLLDLGSGDGRMVFVASLFTKAIGIEIDKELINDSERLKKILTEKKAINPERVSFIEGDFLQHDFSPYDVLISYYDKIFTLDIENKIEREFSGDFYLYNNIYTPNFLKKEKIIWAAQMPVIKIHVPKKK